ncbi:MAG: DUF2892 domain-containing protein [Candidatus Pacebacteria bacterium]|jgi:hypothetical protein|nr:DUF2892 domain-containing protein [Candidatus Paceibacterota bacterium]
MNIKPNEGTIDRMIRIIIAEIFFLLAFFWVSGVAQIVLYVAAAGTLLTAISGFCGLYKIFGVDTASTIKKSPTKIIISFLFVAILVAAMGGYYSNFFTKKIFLEDYNKMNQYYKQTLFYTGQNARPEAVANYALLGEEYALFNAKYQKYHPYALRRDSQLNGDLVKVSNIISELKTQIATGDLKMAHTTLEEVRPVFQDILKRNGFSLLAVALVDFHDAMEKVIAAADAKDAATLIAVYPEVSEKLKAVEDTANDSEIQLIRQKLEEVFLLAKENKVELLSAKAAELKSAFVKVYLKRG